MTDAIFEIKGGEEKIYSVYARMVKERVLFLRGAIDQNVADTVAAQLLYLNHVDKKQPIQLFINSPGGEVTQGLVIYDMIRYIEAPVYTLGIGQCCSMGAFLLAAGTHRYALHSTRIMIHKVSGGAQGQIEDAKRQLGEMARLDDMLNEKMSQFTDGKVSIKEMKELTDRDKYMSPDEAVKIGLIDEVIISSADNKNKDK